ncbi:(3S,6E)-nerolidol synthase 1-like [Prosopis cineraria]|uniref:(3S,6E)-nerolidol synthase 1-like n=1 Tax=Prosopis cineraria TaxID=364024 RepID=UPI0024101219|nr:(3S,6E)-nerolidol synthase 1-like [Prosopis cineraria]
MEVAMAMIFMSLRFATGLLDRMVTMYLQVVWFIVAEVFDMFTDKEGKFSEKVGGNIKGMIDLYGASQLRMEGEAILDEAELFGLKILKERSAHLGVDKAEFVRSTLEQPFHKSLPIFTSRNFLEGTHGMNGWVNALQDVAKMNFNVLQSEYQTEIFHISKWWAELGLANELKYARNQPLKWYIWSLACLTDPSFSEERVVLTKPISFIYLIDDIFDIYGTLEELTVFTKAVTRWDIEATEKLPDYMKICFRALYDVTNEISYKVYLKHGWNPSGSLRKAWGRLCEAFLTEAEWFASGKMPSAEEYLKNGIVSSGVHVVLVHIFFLLGQRLSQETVQKIDNNPTIISSTATILRLWDDLGSAEDENQEGKDGSYMEYVMKEMKEGERAREVVMGKISEAWKGLNREFVLDDTTPHATAHGEPPPGVESHDSTPGGVTWYRKVTFYTGWKVTFLHRVTLPDVESHVSTPGRGPPSIESDFSTPVGFSTGVEKSCRK